MRAFVALLLTPIALALMWFIPSAIGLGVAWVACTVFADGIARFGSPFMCTVEGGGFHYVFLGSAWVIGMVVAALCAGMFAIVFTAINEALGKEEA